MNTNYKDFRVIYICKLKIIIARVRHLRSSHTHLRHWSPHSYRILSFAYFADHLSFILHNLTASLLIIV